MTQPVLEMTLVPKSQQVILVDLSSIAYPAWHTHGGDPNPDAVSQYVVGRVLALSSGAPNVAICVDASRSFRKDIDASYKANRPEREAALTHQIGKAIDALRADGFPIWKADGFEADDVIATATQQAVEAGHTVIIVTADKDLMQLVCDPVRVKSVRDGAMFDEAAVVAKYGVTPSQMRDFLSLCGDSSDNVKGADRVGDKTAQALLAKYGSLADVFAALDRHATDFKPALATSLREFQPRSVTVQQLITLRTDAPIVFADIFRERVVVPFAPEVDMEIEGQDVSESAAVAPSAPTTALVARVEDATPAPAEWERQLEPRSMRDAKLLATDVFNSKLFTSAYGTPQAVLSTVLAGRELGLQAMASLRAIHIVEGKPTLSADLIRALVIRSGLAKTFRCTERTAERATFVTQRGDDPEMSLTVTIDEARQAWGKSKDAWDKSGWGKNPADMLVARAGAKLARLVYPDVVHGIYAPEEMEAA